MHICPGGAMMRTDIVKATGGMREDLRITEDLEFWGYSALFGKWGLIPEVLFMGCGAQTVTSREDWIRRMKRRWDNAPTIEEWEKRLVKKCPSLLQDKSYHLNLYAVDDNGDEILMTKDHIIPRSKGGIDDISNYQTMCRLCNEAKGNKLEN